MFYLPADRKLDKELILKLLNRFQGEKRPKLQRYRNYEMGKQAILQKSYSDTTKPINRVVTNYCDNIVKNYQGYLTGIPVAYQSKLDISPVMEVLDYNDTIAEDNRLLRNGLVYGLSYELHYMDEYAKHRFIYSDPLFSFPVFDNTLGKELLYFFRYYLEDEFSTPAQYILEIYGRNVITRYRVSEGLSSIDYIEEVPHYFNQVPAVVFQANDEHLSIFDKVMDLQDAYNELLSASLDDFAAFNDAYMVLTGVDAEEEDIVRMKEGRVILLPPDNASAAYLTKSSADTQAENLLKAINDNIHKISNSPDFRDEAFAAESGIAIRYKLTAFENTASNIATNFTKALQKRIELIASIAALVDEETVWRDIDIIISRNLPIDNLESAELVNKLRGIVSDKTLISQLEFIQDAQEELEILQEEKAKAYALYAPTFTSEEDEVE